MTDEKKDMAADQSRREREQNVAPAKSGSQERRAGEHTEDDIKEVAVDRASNAAMAHRPAG